MAEIKTVNEYNLVEGIVTSIVRNDEETAKHFADAKAAFVAGQVAHKEADAYQMEGDSDLMGVCRAYADAKRKMYQSHMRKAMDRIVTLTGLPKDEVRDILSMYACEVITDALIEAGM